MADDFPHPIRNGWIPLMPARDLGAGELCRVRAMGEEYLLFETESGEISIWVNKRYFPRPRLCDGEGPIAEGRNWMQQFYSPSTGR